MNTKRSACRTAALLCCALLLTAATTAQESKPPATYVTLYESPVMQLQAIGQPVYHGIAVSRDAGATWKSIGLHIGRTNALALDPADRNTLYAATDVGLMKSKDGGEHWKRVTPYETGEALAVFIHRGNVWIGTPHGPFRSTDAGNNWQAVANGLPPLNATYVSGFLALGDTLVIATADGVYVLATNSDRWMPAGLQGKSIEALAQHPSQPNQCAAFSSSEGLWQSTDGGKSWFERKGVPSKKVQSFAYDPDVPNTLYLGMQDIPVSRSSDNGVTWKVTAAGITNNYITAIAFDPAKKDVMYLGTENGTYVSTNRGGSWLKWSIRAGFVTSIVMERPQ